MDIFTETWLKQLSRYDDAGIKLLFEQYYLSLVLFAKTYVRDVDAARDIVQDVFEVMIQGREKFSSLDNFKTYLYTAVRNKSLKYLRHEEVKMRYGRYVSQHTADDDYDYADKVLEEEVFVLLKKSIDELPEQCRKVFVLALEGNANAEIADCLNIGIETVKSHKKAGRRILFDKLKGAVSALLLFYYWKEYIE